MIAFAIVLLLAVAAGWIAVRGAPAAGRIYLRSAGVLYAALAVSVAGKLAPDAVADIVLPLACTLVALAAFAALRKAPSAAIAAVILTPVCLAGIAASVMDLIMLAIAPQLLASAALLPLARGGSAKRAHRFLLLGAGALFGATACRLAPGVLAETGLLLFSAAGYVGVALSLDGFVEQQSKRGSFSVGR
jgi:hypothetical protein